MIRIRFIETILIAITRRCLIPQNRHRAQWNNGFTTRLKATDPNDAGGELTLACGDLTVACPDPGSGLLSIPTAPAPAVPGPRRGLLSIAPAPAPAVPGTREGSPIDCNGPRTSRTRTPQGT